MAILICHPVILSFCYPVTSLSSSLCFEALVIFLSHVLSSGGIDFHSGPYIVVMPRGSMRVTVSIPIIDDDWYEGPEHFTARIETNSSSGVTPGPRDEAVISVSDNDCECHSVGLCEEVKRLVSVEGQSRNTVTVHILCRRSAPCFPLPLLSLPLPLPLSIPSQALASNWRRTVTALTLDRILLRGHLSQWGGSSHLSKCSCLLRTHARLRVSAPTDGTAGVHPDRPSQGVRLQQCIC